MTHLKTQATVDDALCYSNEGMSDRDNAAIHGVTVATTRRWRRLYQRRGLPRGQQHCGSPCPVCEDGSLDVASYAELLGWYLGDGCLTVQRRGVFGLHIVDDDKYPRDLDRIATLMRSVTVAA